MSNYEELKKFIDAINTALLDFDLAIDAFEESDHTPEESVQALSDLHEVKANFSAVYDRMEYVAARTMGDLPEIDLPDGTKVEKRYGSSRKSWNHKDLASVVASRISDMSVDLDTGERILSTEQMIVKVLDYVQPSYWRVKELNKIGINPDRFCEVSEGKTSIIVRRAK